MSHLVAIDPGVGYSGVAVFDLGTHRLVDAGVVKGEGFKNNLWAVDELAAAIVIRLSGVVGGTVTKVAFEWQQVYSKRARGKKDPNDLLPLGALIGATLVRMHPLLDHADGAEVVLHRPHEWKGSIQKNPTARKVLARLDAEELSRVDEVAPFIRALDGADRERKQVTHPTHNALDAAGLGLHVLGRFNRKRVISR